MSEVFFKNIIKKKKTIRKLVYIELLQDMMLRVRVKKKMSSIPMICFRLVKILNLDLSLDGLIWVLVMEFLGFIQLILTQENMLHARDTIQDLDHGIFRDHQGRKIL